MIKKFHFKKLFLGAFTAKEHSGEHNALSKNVRNVKSIWDNEHHQDLGIEKIVRLLLTFSQFFFIGTYIRQIFSKKNTSVQDFVIDCYVLLKTFFPLFVVWAGLSKNIFFFSIVIWLMAETILYVPTLIFASDLFPKPRSYRRSMLLLCFNYIEIIFSFAVIYASGNFLNQALGSWYDAVYFSFMTSATVGFGDLFPVTFAGKALASVQSIIFVLFVVLFVSFYSTKIEKHGYFGDE